MTASKEEVALTHERSTCGFTLGIVVLRLNHKTFILSHRPQSTGNDSHATAIGNSRCKVNRMGGISPKENKSPEKVEGGGWIMMRGARNRRG